MTIHCRGGVLATEIVAQTKEDVFRNCGPGGQEVTYDDIAEFVKTSHGAEPGSG